RLDGFTLFCSNACFQRVFQSGGIAAALQMATPIHKGLIGDTVNSNASKQQLAVSPGDRK
ncbi:MAG: hypothetical protein KGQ60_18145, partial [Planctomycetes bacterium]|nr:hypothetical protein [Planctomycetota bacterium]